MNKDQIREAFLTLTTPVIADAGRHLHLAVRAASLGIAPVAPEMRLAGRARQPHIKITFKICNSNVLCLVASATDS